MKITDRNGLELREMERHEDGITDQIIMLAPAVKLDRVYTIPTDHTMLANGLTVYGELRIDGELRML